MAARLAACLLASALVVAPRGVAAVTYYVSSSRGSDGFAGTSPASPWSTLRHAAASVAPGDTLLLRETDEWLLAEPWQLTVSPLELASYADGAASDRPRIVRNTTANPVGPVIAFHNPAFVSVNFIEVSGAEEGILFFFNTSGAPATFTNISVTSCFLHRIHGSAYNASTGSWWGVAVSLAAANSGITVLDAVIANNLVADSDTFYANSAPIPDTTRAYVARLNIQGNMLTRISYNSLFLDTTSFVAVQGNVFLRDTPAQLFVAGTTDIILGTVNSSVSMTGNEIGWRGEYQPGGPDGCAIDFETQADGVLVADNYIHHSYGAGIMVFGHTTTSTNLRFDSNIMLYNGCNQTRSDHGGIAFMHLNSSGVVSNSVFATCVGTPIFYPLEPGAMDGWAFVNNTLYAATDAVPVVATPSVTAQCDGAGSIVVTALQPSQSPAPPAVVLHYTVDGSRPEPQSPVLFSGVPVTVGTATTGVLVKAFAVGPGSEGWLPSAAEGNVFGCSGGGL